LEGKVKVAVMVQVCFKCNPCSALTKMSTWIAIVHPVF